MKCDSFVCFISRELQKIVSEYQATMGGIGLLVLQRNNHAIEIKWFYSVKSGYSLISNLKA